MSLRPPKSTELNEQTTVGRAVLSLLKRDQPFQVVGLTCGVGAHAVCSEIRDVERA
jgi:hypothetical protein